jgi:glycosyltransferase involved in cell wall biosynthesis
MIKGKDIIVVGLQPWDIKIGSNCKNIAIELSKFNRVLYVNPPIDQFTLLKNRSEPAISKRLELIRTKKNLISVGEKIWNLYPGNIIYSINWLPGNRLFSFFNKVNNKKFSRDILRAVEKLDFKNYLLFNDSDMLRSFSLIEILKPAFSIYYSRDNLMAVPYWYKHGHVLEPQLMKKSTIVCTNSEYLAEIAKKYNPHSFYVGQGCDLSKFDRSKEFTVPEDMRHIKGPIIGYIGALLSLRLDLNLLAELCSIKKEWSFVFVGKEDDAFKNSPLHHLSNVHFLGLKEESLLASYLNQFNVAINPQVINELTAGNYPRKIDEYLAMGKPVVATSTKTMQTFSSYVYLAKTTSEYIESIERALHENNPNLEQERIQFAKTHTWENSVDAICRAILLVNPKMSDSRQEVHQLFHQITDKDQF